MFQKRVLFQLGMRIAFFAACFFISSDVMAATTSPTLGVIKGDIDTSVKNIMSILQDVAMVTGVGFVIASFFKFHQHKMQPTQIPLSQGVTLLLVGAGLTVFPSLLGTTTKSAFGVTAGQGTVTGYIQGSS